MTHNEMPKDTVEELAKELAILFQVEGTRQEKKIRNAIITAYNKGVEVVKERVEKLPQTRVWLLPDGELTEEWYIKKDDIINALSEEVSL